MNKLVKKLLSFLRVRPTAAGLEISDQVIRLGTSNGGIWKMHAIRLAPGIIENGTLQNKNAFIESLMALRKDATGRKGGKKLNVVLCISSAPLYTQAFLLPSVKGKTLAEAVALNLRMVSPFKEEDSYSGWQLIGRDEKTLQLEILSVFVERKMVDDIADALFNAGFVVMAVESRAVALTRILDEKGAGIDKTKSYLFINVDNAGIDFLIIKNGSPYFEYTTAWKEVAGDKGEIEVEKFESVLATQILQMTNFYAQHMSVPLSAVIISAVALKDSVQKVVTSNVTAPVVELSLEMGQPVSSEWLTTIGCSLRTYSDEGEVNLLGDNSKNRFYEELFISFMRFWRLVVPCALILLVATLGIAYKFLVGIRVDLESRSLPVADGGSSDVALLVTAAQNFNQSLSLLVNTESMLKPKAPMFKDIMDIASANGISIGRITLQIGNTLSLTGSGSSQDGVLAFKSALAADKNVEGVDLPLSGIQTNGSTVSFSMTFIYAAPVQQH